MGARERTAGPVGQCLSQMAKQHISWKDNVTNEVETKTGLKTYIHR